MKRATAVKNALEIAQRVKSVNGILCTPKHNRDAVRIKKVWLFGSAAKGSENPNDLDIFVEMSAVGRIHLKTKSNDLILDKEGRRRHGYTFAADSELCFIKWLKRGMKNVSVHVVGRDLIFDRLDKKVMLYPRNDLSKPGLHYLAG